MSAIVEAVKNELTADLGIPFQAGLLEGVVEEADAGGVWLIRVQEDPDNVNIEQVLLGFRIFKAHRTDVDPEKAFEAAPLEALADSVRTSLKDKQAGLGGSWYGRVTRVDVLNEKQGIEGLILCYQENLFAP